MRKPPTSKTMSVPTSPAVRRAGNGRNTRGRRSDKGGNIRRGTRGIPLSVLRGAVADREKRQMKREMEMQMLETKNRKLRERLAKLAEGLSSRNGRTEEQLLQGMSATQYVFETSAICRGK